jgi:hypothetical protein
MKMATILASAAALSLVPASGGAQAPAATAVKAAPVDAQKVIADVRRILAANYVLPDVRPKLDAALATALASGRYNVSDPGELAAKINEDLTAVAHDKHLSIHYAPEQAAEIAARPDGGDDDAPPSPEEMHRAIQLNHGITEMKVLPGNLRYMNLVGFFWGGAPTAAAYDNAMRFLKDGDAAIIDLRDNGGGSPEAVQYLVSHFLEPNKPIVTFYMGADKVDHFKSLDKLPAGRLIGKPLYVLTSGHTASAGEEFTGHIAGFKLGELIGETTAGAGFRNTFFPVADGYVMSVSVGRAVLASTGKDWEGVGIPPTTKVEQEKALDVAQAHALHKLAAAATGRDAKMLEARAALMDAKITAIAPALPLAAYAGTYGERIISMDGKALQWQRGNGPKIEMVPVGPNEFSFDEDPMTRVRFTAAGNSVTALELLRGDGSKVEAARTQ